MYHRLFRFSAYALLGLALLAFFSLASTAQGDNLFLSAFHSDMKGPTNFLASNNGANNTVWNSYVWGGTHPGLYGASILQAKPLPYLALEEPTPFVQEGGLFVTTIKMLPGIEWSDGTEITAADVAFTFNSMVTPLESGNSLALELGGGYPGLYDDAFIDHVDAVDAHTVKFFMKQRPGLARWEFGILQAWIFPSHYWQSRFDQAFASADPVVTLSGFNTADEPTAGGFAFNRWEPGAFAEIAKNPNYSFEGTVAKEYSTGGYSEVLPDGTARSFGDTSGSVALEYTTGPTVDGVIYNIFGNQAAAALAVINGDVDYHYNPLGYGKATLDQLNSTQGVRVITNNASGFFYMAFNMRKAPFNFLEFRQAVRCVIDKEFVSDQLLSGLVVPAPGVVPPGNQLFYQGLNAAQSDIACVGLSEADRLAKARSILEGAGFKFDDSGTLTTDPDGGAIPQLELLHPNAAYDNNRNIFGLHIVDRMNKLGVPVRDVPAGFNNIVTLVFDQQDFDMWQLGWSIGSFPDYVWDFFESSNTTLGGNAAQGGVCSSRENALNGCQESYDQLANAFLAETDLEAAVTQNKQLQSLIFDSVGYIPTHFSAQNDAYRVDRVNWQGLEDLPLYGGLESGQGYRDLVRKAAQ